MLLPISGITLNYTDAEGDPHHQPLTDIFEVGTLIDPNTDNDMDPYDKAKFTSQDEDCFVIVRGGLVQNEPIIPVIDLDILDADVVNNDIYIDDCLNTLQNFANAYQTNPYVKDAYSDEINELINCVIDNGNYQQHVLLHLILDQLGIANQVK